MLSKLGGAFLIQIKMFKANEGDALLVSFGGNKQYNIMIDMGLDVTYFNHIKPELEKIKQMGRKLDLLVITHIDEDHILGGLEFLKENGQNGEIVKVDEVWHNTYRHLQFEKEKIDKLSIQQKRNVEGIIMSNRPKVSKQSGSKDISVKQGISFGGYIICNKNKWNERFGKGVVTSKIKQNYIDLNENIRILVLSPDENKLKALAKKWLRDLEVIFNIKDISNEVIWDDAFEYYIQHLRVNDCSTLNISDIRVTEKKIKEWALEEERDSSYTNGSSISFIIEYNTKKLLFLGDSHEDIIYEKLSELKSKGYELDFEVIKLSHHGSNKNISKRLMNLIEGKRFLISTDGKRHGHPNMKALAKIITKSQVHKKELIFNYKIEKVRLLQNEGLEEKYNYSIRFLTDNETINVE